MDIPLWIGIVSGVAGLVAAFASVWNWFKLNALERINDPVTVSLKETGGDRRVELPFEMRRRNATRAEICGILGMFPMRKAGDRYAVDFLFTRTFSQRINDVQEGRSSRLEIDCSSGELDQFDLEKIDAVTTK